MTTDPFITLSREQQHAMLTDDNVFLTACPGSGKTYSVAGRFAWKARRGLRVAVLSHTNVAADEVGSAIHRQYELDPSQEHFSGTIHSFLTRYLLEPFAHLVAGAQTSLSVDEDAVRQLNRTAFDLLQYRFTPTGGLISRNKKADASTAALDQVRRAKLDIAAMGVVSFDDAVYWSLKVLDGYPHVARALALRFDEIIVDEAQDSSELQLACLRHIQRQGLASLVLVGDFDQSIYGFGGARPELCAQLARDAGLRETRLMENYRSSQAICNVTAAFRSRKTPDRAVGAAAEITDAPKLLLYDPATPSTLLEKWDTLVRSFPHPIDSRAILTRNNDLASNIRPSGPRSVPVVYRLLFEARRSSPRIDVRTVRELGRELFRLATSDYRARVSDFDAELLRAVVIRAIRSAPDVRGSLNEWFTAAQAVLIAAGRELGPATFRLAAVPAPPQAGSLSADAPGLFGDPVGDSRVGSVHSVKGESIDAVMLVAAPARSWGTPEAENWASILTDPSNMSEENRIAYVGMTRARRLLALAVPADTAAWALAAFAEVGFELLQS